LEGQDLLTFQVRLASGPESRVVFVGGHPPIKEERKKGSDATAFGDKDKSEEPLAKIGKMKKGKS